MKVGIVMGSKSDYPVVEKTEKILDEFNIDYESRVMSAHRTPNEVVEFVESFDDRGIDVVIAFAGKAAHLGGVIAAHTVIPVIAVPIKTSVMGGMDSLLSTVQMPKGIPVATVAIDGGENAALLSISMLSIRDEKLKKKLIGYREGMRKQVILDDESMRG